MSDLKTLSSTRCFGGTQLVLEHPSDATGTPMRLSAFLPAHTEVGPRPVLFYLSGLTCTEQNATTKAGFQRLAAELGIVVVCPDTSPRGADLPGESDAWDFGLGAGFYVDATEAPWASHYRMWSYVTDELPELCAEQLPVDLDRCGVMGHSMGGHGALVCALRFPDRYRSVSAFAPICHPSVVPWGEKAFGGFLGDDRARWLEYDAVELIKAGSRVDDLLVDQGGDDSFLDEQLRPDDLAEACADAGIHLTLNIREGYDHSYYFISTFIEDHLQWHAARLLSVS